jgi:type IV pilus assembly protein PilB
MHSPFNSIFTLEDPVEQIIPQFQQIEIRGQMTFGAGLKSLLRQDPDVMLVGEIRDEETATLALKGANTGHLVLSTLHTNNSHACIGRMIDLGCDRSTLAEALKGVTAQRMVDIVCPHCSEKIPLHDVPEYRDSYATLPIWKPDQMIRVAKKGGCDQCNRIGYRGRHPVQEIFVMDALAKEMISRAAIPSQIRTAQIEAGSFDTIWMDGYRLVAAGVTTFDALERRLDIDEALVTKDTVAAIVKKSSTAMQPAAGGVNTSTVQIGTGARAISSLPMR